MLLSQVGDSKATYIPFFFRRVTDLPSVLDSESISTFTLRHLSVIDKYELEKAYLSLSFFPLAV